MVDLKSNGMRQPHGAKFVGHTSTLTMLPLLARIWDFPSKYRYLRNEFHFSGVHGAMNRSGSRAK